MAKVDSKCISETISTFGFLDKERAKDLEESIVALLEENKDVPVENLRKEILDITKLESKKMREYSMVQIGDEIKRSKLKNEISSGFTKEVKTIKDAKKKIKHYTKQFLSKIEGKNSVDTLYRVEANLLKNAHYGGLKRAGVFEHYVSGKYDDLVAEQVWRKANKKKSVMEDLPEGYTKEQAEIAMRIAEVSKKSTDLMLNNQRSVGIPIAERRDWLYKHTYSKTKLTSMGPDGFEALLEQYANMEDMFNKNVLADPAKKSAAIKDLHEAIVASKDMFKGQAQKSGFMSKLKNRKIEFKSGIDESKFFKEVSDHVGLVENMEIAMDQAAKTYSTVKTLGVRSEENFNQVMSEMEADFRKSVEGKFTPDETNKLINDYQLKMHAIKDSYKVVSANPHTPKGAITNIVNVLRALNSMTKLGSSLFTSMYDGVTLSLQYSMASSDNQFKAFGQTMIDGMTMLKDADKRREFGEILNTMTYIHDPALAMGGNRGDFKTGMDMFNKFVTNVYRVTGVPFQTEISRNTGALLQSRAIKKAVSTFAKDGKLDPLQKIRLDRYGITEADMKLLSSVKAEDGMPDIISPTHVFDIELDKFHANPDVAYKLRRDLFDKVGAWVDDGVQAGTPTPTARTKRILRKGENIENEYVRAGMNLMMQFKETAAKIVDENIQAWNDMGEAHGSVGQAKGLGLYALNGMVTYMLVENARAYVTGGKSPMDRYKKDGGKAMFMDYVSKASFLPVLTDMAGAAEGKYWRSALPNSVLGPTFSMGMDTLQAMHNPNRKNIGKVGKHLIPLQNHFGVKYLERQMLGIDFMTGQKIRK